jgi:putative salt-induced outer membrane protein YdiY
VQDRHRILVKWCASWRCRRCGAAAAHAGRGALRARHARPRRFQQADVVALERLHDPGTHEQMTDERGPLGALSALRARLSLCIALISLCALAASPARADVVLLRNGDRLTGTAVHMKANQLAFATSYAGTLLIKWSDIASLVTVKPVTLVIGNEHVLSGKLGAGMTPGRAALTPTTAVAASADFLAPREIPLASVRFLNPTVDESGSGIAWSGRINAGGASTSGNSTNGSMHVDVDATGRARQYRILGGGEFNHATDHYSETVSNWRARGEFDRFYEKKMFSYTRTTFEHDKFKALGLRSTLGGGLGYQFFESAALNLSVQGGLDYVDVNNLDVADDRYAALAWVMRYDQKPWTLNMQFFHQEDGTVSIDSPSNVVLHTQTGVRAPLGLGINATLQYNYDWNNRPPQGRVDADRTLLFTLGYAW